LSMYTVEQRGFLVRKHWQTGSFKACQTAYRTEFGERRAPSKCSVQKLVKKSETREADLTPADFFLWGQLKVKVYKNTPRTIEQLYTLYAKRFKPSTSTLWEKYSRNWRNAFKCAWMRKETSFSIDYEQVLFCIVPGMCI